MELLETAVLLEQRQKNEKFIKDLRDAEEQIKICLKEALTKQLSINQQITAIMRMK